LTNSVVPPVVARVKSVIAGGVTVSTKTLLVTGALRASPPYLATMRCTPGVSTAVLNAATLALSVAEPLGVELLVMSSSVTCPVAVRFELLKVAVRVPVPKAMTDAPLSVRVSKNPCPLPVPGFLPEIV
jgi:hypothetical protein